VNWAAVDAGSFGDVDSEEERVSIRRMFLQSRGTYVAVLAALGCVSCRETAQQPVGNPATTSHASADVQTPVREPEVPVALPSVVPSSSGKSEPVAATTAMPSSSVVGKAALAGPVSAMILNKRFDAARALCLQAVGAGKLFSKSDYAVCRSACRGDSDNTPPVAADASCASGVHTAKRAF
jgi:hypothetical protein